MAGEKKSVGVPDSIALLLFFVFWYAGNALYNGYNNGALIAAGGKNAGLTMTISTMQLGVCSAYALLMWLVRFNPIKLCGLQMPESQPLPAITTMDFVKTIPVGFCSAAAHSSSVFALGGDPLFGQIVKAGEPVLSAFVGVFYGKFESITKVLCLPIIVGGVAFASMKKGADGGYALKFDTTALVFGMIANGFAAIKGQENAKLMSDKGIYARFGGIGNQFAVTEIIAFLCSLPVMFATEGKNFGKFCDLFMSSKELQFQLVMSGLTFYIYNELATMTIKKTSAVTSSVANTAKRVIVMVYMAAVTGKALTEEQKIGAAVAITGVLIYSVIDDILKPKKAAVKTA
jgi:solute carrier family 35 protein E1